MLPLNPKGELKEGWYNPKENNDDRSKVFDRQFYGKKNQLFLFLQNHSG